MRLNLPIYDKAAGHTEPREGAAMCSITIRQPALYHDEVGVEKTKKSSDHTGNAERREQHRHYIV